MVSRPDATWTAPTTAMATYTMFETNIMSGMMSPEMNCAFRLASYSSVLVSSNVAISSACRPKAVTTKAGEPEYIAEAVPLELGQREPGWVEVLKGLQPGDVVVSKGAEALEDGTPLAIPAERMSLMQNGR